MKKIIALIAAVVTLGASAQTSIQLTNVNTSLTIQPNSTIYGVTDPEEVLTYTIDIKNTSASTKSYKVARYDQILHVGPSFTASAYFCVAGTCYPAETDTSGSTLVLNTGESASQMTGDYQMLQADLYEADSKGLSVVKYKVYNINDANDFFVFTIQYNGTIPTGIAEAKQNRAVGLRLFPNPNNTGVVTVETDSEQAKIEVINMLGSIVLKQESNGATELNVANLPAGTYFVKVSGNKNVVTERLIITK